MPDNTEDMVRLAYLLILLMALLGFSLFGGPRAVMAAAGRLIVWGLIFAMAIIAYSYRDTIRGALFPATAVRMEGGGVELRRGADGHFQATLEINGEPIRFIVDTGATEIVLARADAAKAGIDLDALVFSGRAITANGPVPTARVRLDSVTLGDVTARNLPASVTAGALQTSLLGMTYLNRFERIEISGDRMRLTH